MDRRDFLGIEGLGEEDADQLLRLIDELTVVEGEATAEEGVPPEAGGDDESDESSDEGAAEEEASGEASDDDGDGPEG